MAINAIQAAIRPMTGTERQFNGDLHAYWDQIGIPPGQFAERMVAWKALPQNAAWIDATEDADAPEVVAGLWRNGEQGVWYDASDLSTMFQDAAGTLPVYAPGSGQVDPPVGLWLDKRLGLSKGPELLTNGEFASDSGWTKNAGWGIGGGSAVRAPDAAASTLTQNIPLAAGVAYVVEYTISSITAGSITPRLSGGVTVAGNARTAAGTYKEVLVSAAGNTRLELYANAVANATIDIVSLRALPGNHAYQTTTTSRPTLSARYNLLTATENMAAVWSVFNGTFSSAGNYWKFTESATVSLHSFLQTPSQPKAASYRASFVGKPDGRSVVRLALNAYTGNFAEVRFNLATGMALGTFSGGDGVVESYSITPVGDGAYRCTMVGRPSSAASGSAFDVSLGLMDGVNSTYAGDGVSGILVNYFDCRSANDGIGLPPYQRVVDASTYDTVGFPLYLRFDGVDDWLQTASIDFSAYARIVIAASIRKLSDATTGTIAELSPVVNTSNGAFALFGPLSTSTPGIGLRYSGATPFQDIHAPLAGQASAVVLATIGLDSAGAKMAVNGTWYSNPSPAGGGVLGNYALYIGRRGGASLPFSGRLFTLQLRGGGATDAQLTAMGRYLNQKARIY